MAEPPQSEEMQVQEVDRDDMLTQDGTVDRKGSPAKYGSSGGWIPGAINLLNQGLVTLALFGVSVNLVTFMTGVLHQENATAANSINNWQGTIYVSSLIGAFVADSYWGRYKTCAVFQLIFVAGLLELTVASYFMLRIPCRHTNGSQKCDPPSKALTVIFYLAIYQIGLGNGGYQPSATTFGADQFDENDKKEAVNKVAFFSYFYLANNVGTIFSNTYLVYLEDKGKWDLAFGISAGSAFIALVLFFAGVPWYRHFKPGGNPLARFGQVIVAAVKKRKAVVPPPGGKELYEVRGKQSALNGGRKIQHSPDFKFLDRAAVITPNDLPLPLPEDPSAAPPNPWSLCTITQVEEVKCVLRLIPIWLCSIIYSVVFTQMNSVYVEQGQAMNSTIAKFNIPAATMSIFEILGVAVAVPINRFYLYIYSLFEKTKGNPKKTMELQRMAIGLIMAGITMVVSAVVETERLKRARPDCDGCDPTSSFSILWQIPQWMLIGISEVFLYVAQIEFFNDQCPDGLKSFASALYMASVALGNYVNSLIVTVVMEVTTKGGRAGWVSENLNHGHLDRFYYLIAILSAVNFVVYVVCAKRYRCIVLEKEEEEEELGKIGGDVVVSMGKDC